MESAKPLSDEVSCGRKFVSVLLSAPQLSDNRLCFGGEFESSGSVDELVASSIVGSSRVARLSLFLRFSDRRVETRQFKALNS